MIRPLLVATRPRQWIKNLFVGAPLIFAKSLLDRDLALRAAAAVAIFCVISSAVYLWNDIIDVEKDRAHPRKRTRPIAAGTLSLPAARVAAASFAAVGLVLALLLSPLFALAAGAYLVLNVAYSLVVKRVPYLDVLSISSGFLLRVWGGSMAIHISPSPWLLLCTGLFACFLGFGKRAHELSTAGERGATQRAVLSSYRPAHLRYALYLTGAATLLAYSFYTRSAHTFAYFGQAAGGRMVWTVPFIAVAIVRFMTLTSDRPRSESPTEEMLRDPLLIVNFVAWVGVVVAIIYFAK